MEMITKLSWWKLSRGSRLGSFLRFSVLIAAFLGASISNANRVKEESNDFLFTASEDVKVEDLRADVRNLFPHASEIETVSKEHHVYRVRTGEQKKIIRAMQRFDRIPGVLRSSPNSNYRAAIRYHFQKESSDTGFSPMSLGRFFVNPGELGGFAAMSVLPPVNLPGRRGKFGVDALLNQDWAMTSAGFDQSHDSLTTSQVITAVIDTGVDYNHEDLRYAMWRKPGNKRVVGYDFAHDNAQPFDVVKFDLEGCFKDTKCFIKNENIDEYMVNGGHGTHCAGHVAAVANNSIGIRGMGSDVKVMALKFFYDAGEPYAGQGDSQGAIQSIDYAIKNGAKVINASWGHREMRFVAERSELKQALIRAQQAGVIVVIAAGNDGINQDEEFYPSYPAAYELDNLIVVAASNQQDQLAEFSNYGAKSVHIAAPGTQILSTVVGGKYQDYVAKAVHPISGAVIQIPWDGTSMAAPVVAGAVAAIWSAYPHESYQEIRNRVLNSARKVPGLDGKILTGGVIDVGAALAL